jgi:hypothetical protein
VATDVNNDFKPGWNPMACSDTAMLPNTLLIAKLSVLILLADGFWRQLRGPFIPAEGMFSIFPDHAAVTAAMHLVFFGLAMCVLLNRFVRPASAILGAFIILLQVASMTAFRGPDLLCGSLLLLAGLQGERDEPVLIRWQVVLVHAAAVLEATRTNGWGGVWIADRWIPEDFSNPVFLMLEAVMPSGWFGMLAAGFVALAELILVVAFLQRRFRKYAVWSGLILHAGIYAATGTTETAAFTAALFVAYLSFLNWPKESVCALWPRSCGWPMWLRIALDRYDFDGRIDWPLPPDPNAELEVSYGNRHTMDARALRDLLLLFPAFYFFLFAFAAINQWLWPVTISVALNGTLAFGLLWFFSVSSFRRIRSRWRSRFSDSRS